MAQPQPPPRLLELAAAQAADFPPLTIQAPARRLQARARAVTMLADMLDAAVARRGSQALHGGVPRHVGGGAGPRVAEALGR